MSRFFTCSQFFAATVFFILLSGQSPLSADESAADGSRAAAGAIAPGDIQKTIDLLENDESRQEILRLLKLMAALEESGEGDARPLKAETDNNEEAEGLSRAAAKSWLAAQAAEFWRQIRTIGPGLAQSWRSMAEVFSSLADPLALELWRPYVLKIFLWGLFCLTATWLIIRRYGRVPDLCFSEPRRGNAPPQFSGGLNVSAGSELDSPLTFSIRKRVLGILKYALTIGGPNLLLIISLWFIPPISATGPGITADMGIGFSFLHTFIQHFFINLSVLYIALRVASAVFKPGCRGRSLIDVHPVVSRHFLNSFRTFSVYIACYVFIDETFLNHFASGVIYKLCLIAMTLPIPFYLTVRILKLKRISHLVSEAESSGRFSDDIADAASNTDEDPQEMDPEPAAPRLDYWFDLLFKKYWAVLAVLMVWVLTLASLVNPLNVAVMFGWRLAASLAVCALAASGVRISRVLMLRLIDEEAGHGRHLVLNTDNFFNIVIWSLTLLVLVSIWGLPVSTLARNDLAREFFSRSFTIVLVVAVLAVFIRFSHLAADWLMAVPSLSSNRNLRTITPLALAAMRFLAVFVALVVVLDRLGVNIGPILAGAGILGLGVGMGAQSLVKDVINGASILMMDTLSVGDWVTVGGKSGTVETVGLRSIRLRDSAGNLNVVPNSSIDVIVNMTRDYSQDLIEFTAPYDADPDDMLKLSAEVAADLSADPAWRRRLIAPISVVGVVGFDSGGTTIRLKVSTTAGEQWAVGRELRLRLKRRMLKDGLKSPWFGRNVFLFKGGAGQGVEAGPDLSDQDLTAAESEKGPGGVDSK